MKAKRELELDFTVYPLEGIWDLSEKGRQLATLNKDELVYTLMLRQPDFFTTEFVEKMILEPNNPLHQTIGFETLSDGQCLQILHVGPYDTEPKSFVKMDQYAHEHNLIRESLTHKEIYLSHNRCGCLTNKRRSYALKCAKSVFL